MKEELQAALKDVMKGNHQLQDAFYKKSAFIRRWRGWTEEMN